MRKRIAGLFIFLSFFASAFSQRILNLEECRELAVDNNKLLKIASEQERVAYYQKKEAITKYFPELSFVGTYLRNGKNPNLLPSTINMPAIDIPELSMQLPPSQMALPDRIRKIGENVKKKRQG